VIPAVKRMGVPVIAMTGKPGSRLAQVSDVHLDVSVEKEACPLNLAPTASTTVTLALGDASPWRCWSCAASSRKISPCRTRAAPWAASC
jgi:D-arabinose 5-phosphate isomerase GutQ